MPLEKSLSESVFEMVERAQLGFQILDESWTYRYLNQAIEAHSGHAREDLIGKTLMECFPGIEDTGLFRDLLFVMRTRQSIFRENEFELESGESRVFELSIEPHPLGISVISKDITGSRLALKKDRSLTRFDHSLEQLTRRICHDFNNQLSVMLAYTEIAEKEVQNSNEKIKQCLSKVSRAVRKSAQLNEELFALVKRHEDKKLRVNLSEKLKQLRSLCEIVLDEKIQFQIAIPSEDLWVSVDWVELRRVILTQIFDFRILMVSGGCVNISLCQSSRKGSQAELVLQAISSEEDPLFGENFEGRYKTELSNLNFDSPQDFIEVFAKTNGCDLDFKFDRNQVEIRLFLPRLINLAKMS